MSEAVDPAVVAARFFVYALAIALFGAGVFPLVRAAKPGPKPATALVGLTLTIAALTYLGLLAREASGATALPTMRVVVQLVGAAPFGWALLACAAAALGAGALALLAPDRLRLRLAIAAVALGSLAFVGHAADGTGLRAAERVAIMATHLLAVGAWLGTLVPLAAALWRPPADGALLRRYGDFALIAVFVVFGSGLASLTFVVVDAQGALGPSYLATLAIKLGFVAALLAAAALNRFWLTPLAEAKPGRAAIWLRITLLAEQALGLGAIASVALLGQLDPTM